MQLDFKHFFALLRTSVKQAKKMNINIIYYLLIHIYTLYKYIQLITYRGTISDNINLMGIIEY